MPASLDQQAHGLHEVVVVEEGLALSHEDEVDAVAVDLDLLVVEDGEDLADDFAGGEVALEAEEGGHAEGASTAQPTWLETQMVARCQPSPRSLAAPEGTAG